MKFQRAIVAILFLAAGMIPAAPSRASDPPQQAPSDAETRERAAKLIENQHKNDAALEQYERIEHYVERTTGANARVILDKTYRIVPNGAGTTKVLISDHGMPVGTADYRREMEILRGVLEMMSNPKDGRAKAAYEKSEKRKRERADFVDVARTAFVVKWQNWEIRDERPCDVFILNPNPNFHPHSMFQDALAHVTAKIYVDRETDQMIRGEADVTSDIYFGAGILGRLSRGSQVSMEQAEVAPGVWLPVRYQYDYSGRKFVFSFSQHQTIEASRYHRVGPPAEALVAIERELAAGAPNPADP